MQSVKAKATTNTKSELKEAFALWKQVAKDGKTTYLTGKTSDDQPMRLVAYYNSVKKNPKQPDITVYEKVEKGKDRNQVASLWETTSKSGKKYMTGSTNDNEKLVAFYNVNTQDGKYPTIRVYYKD